MAIESFKTEKTFERPEEELAYLRERLREKEEELLSKGEKVDTEKAISDDIEEYKKTKSSDVLSDGFQVGENEAAAITLNLSPEEHDEKMSELLGILHEKGIKNTLSIVSKMNDPHIEDDFHRFLVQYIKGGYAVDGLKEKSPLWKSLKMTLFEVSLPRSKKEDGTIKELISSMEQFYSGMLSVAKTDKENDYFTLEIAVSEDSEEIVMYMAVPDGKKALFGRQIHSIFPDAQIVEQNDDYNIFIEGGETVGAIAKLSKNFVFPLKTYEDFDYDPLNITLNAFSKIPKHVSGASLQIVFKPRGNYYTDKFSKAFKDLLKGKSVHEATDISYGIGDDLRKGFKGLAQSIFSVSDKKEDKIEKPKEVDTEAAESIKKKIERPVVATNIRILASSKNPGEADVILSSLEAAFNQFENTPRNAIEFKTVKKQKLDDLIEDFSYRRYIEKEAIPLNLREITSIMHLPLSGIKSSPELRQSGTKGVPAPIDVAGEGTLLGINVSRGEEKKIYLTDKDRLRHFYVIGQTGTGKTNLLKNMILQDIENGDGCCFIDPHGSDVQDILANIPEERWKDVIYFDPGYTKRVMGLNMLEYDERYPEQKTFVVNELFSIFQKLYGGVPESMGPMFEQYFRNAATLVLEDPESGSTLLDISRVLADAKFREMKLSKSKNPVVNQFWREIASKAKGEGQLENIVPYITSKFDVFLANEIMRPIVAQQKSTFNFRKIMDEKKILLVNLSKGKLGDINSNLLGLILVGKILIAALSRTEISEGSDNPFYLYIDEFQNVTTDSISTIFSEARKYKLSLNVAHQFIAQLDDKIKDSVFGNVGSIASFRVGSEDAEFLEKQFEPVFTANDLINIDNFNAYVRILSNGRPVKPFNIKAIAPKEGSKDTAERVKELSYIKYGEPREDVERRVLEKYQEML